MVSVAPFWSQFWTATELGRIWFYFCVREGGVVRGMGLAVRVTECVQSGGFALRSRAICSDRTVPFTNSVGHGPRSGEGWWQLKLRPCLGCSARESGVLMAQDLDGRLAFRPS